MNLRTIPRYGVRSIPGDEKEIIAAFQRGQAVQGPATEAFEQLFANYHYMEHALATSFGRMAFYYILRAFNFPAQSEVIFPALTFWAVPEMARQAGYRPVFVDVDPLTFNIDSQKIEAAITDRTRAIVPTHLYGRPCEMNKIMQIATVHDLAVIEDCAQAAGARHRGRLVGTFGDASFFSFQMLKGINTYGGGMAITGNPVLSSRIREQINAEPWPSAADLARRFASGLAARMGISPRGFTFWGWPLQASASVFGHHDLSKFIWEKIRPLDPFPRAYRQRYSNAQAILGIRGLAQLDEFNARSQAHAFSYARGLAGCRSIQTAAADEECDNVYYQYCVYISDAARASRRAIRKGVDFETTHVDVCSSLPLFKEFAADCPGAELTAKALQLPVYSRLRDTDASRVLRVVREVTQDLEPIAETAEASIFVKGDQLQSWHPASG
ncbi:MAG TPA: DegT/DnrJ/EryC1/StrS aminotransferase family protein [Pyrinomonadaceae bacterium]|nr:DegT/DnrJ/EryC1/StrS aminotransferase family protein [Pyrinomonadaceae bacterium]